MTEAEEQGSNPSDATIASDVPSQGDEGPVAAQAAPTAAIPNASSIAGGPSSSQYRIGHFPNTEGGEIAAMILAIKHTAKLHLERVKSIESLGKGHWAIFIMGMVNDHMKEFTDIPPIVFSLDKEIDDKRCKPIRKENSTYIQARCNAASRGILNLSVESRPDVRQAIERTLEHHEPGIKHHYAYKQSTAV